MKLHSLKYFLSVIVCAVALCAGGWLWNYYMQSPWTRDGKVRAELVSVTPEVSGRITRVAVRDNQAVTRGSCCSRWIASRSLLPAIGPARR